MGMCCRWLYSMGICDGVLPALTGLLVDQASVCALPHATFVIFLPENRADAGQQHERNDYLTSLRKLVFTREVTSLRGFELAYALKISSHLSLSIRQESNMNYVHPHLT